MLPRSIAQLAAEHGLVGSMGRRGNPYDNAKAESFMKTLKVEAVYLMAYETFEDVTAAFRASSTRSTTAAAPLRARLSQPRAVRGSPRPADGQNRSLNLSTARGALHRVGKSFLHVAGLVSAAMCSACRCGSHDRWP